MSWGGLAILGLAAGLGAPRLFALGKTVLRKAGGIKYSSNGAEAYATPAVDPARGIAA